MREFQINQLEAVHLVAACLGLVLGLLVLILKKGTRTHVRIGYMYATTMLVVNLPVLFTYQLYGRFGIFHVFAVVSLVTLAYGMGSALLRRPRKAWLRLHLSGMYWSVMGLYFAGCAQLMVTFRWTGVQVLIGALVLAAVSTFFYGRYMKGWLRVPSKAFRAT